MIEVNSKQIETYFEIRNFLIREAELLDNGNFAEWFQLFTKDVLYQIPVRTTRYRKDGTGISDKMYHVDDDYYILNKRVKRLQTAFAWSEDPPSRTRRIISNIRFKKKEGAEEYEVKSNFILYRSRSDLATYDVLSGERHDVLKEVDGSMKISKRLVVLDQSNLSLNNLGLFL